MVGSWAAPSHVRTPAAWKMTIQQAPSRVHLRVTFFSPSNASFQVLLCHQRQMWPLACHRTLQATALPPASVSGVAGTVLGRVVDPFATAQSSLPLTGP